MVANPIDPFGGGEPKRKDNETGETDARAVHSGARMIEKDFEEFKEKLGGESANGR